MIRRFLPLLVLLVVVTACGDQLEGKFGEGLYQEGCAHCHGADLSGGVGPAIGAGSVADVELSDQQIADVIRVGPGSMPGFDDRLTDEQIESLVEYLRVQSLES